jgi:hypothetical protein
MLWQQTLTDEEKSARIAQGASDRKILMQQGHAMHDQQEQP